MRVLFSNHSPIHIDARTISAWFPQLAYTQCVTADDLVEQLELRLQRRYHVKSHHIKEVLHQLFGVLGQHSRSVQEQTQMHVIKALLDQLMSDVQTAWHTDGLRHSRHSFIILAYLAEEQDSFLLAQALSQFWHQGRPLIAQESPRWEGDWQKAWEKIQEAMDGPTTMDLAPLAMMPYAGLHRGRSPRALAIPWSGHRARSLPAMRRRHNPEMRLAIPAFARSNWASPMISPVGYPRNDYFEELDNLQYQQSEMSMKLSNVDEKLDLLLTGGYY